MSNLCTSPYVNAQEQILKSIHFFQVIPIYLPALLTWTRSESCVLDETKRLLNRAVCKVPVDPVTFLSNGNSFGGVVPEPACEEPPSAGVLELNRLRGMKRKLAIGLFGYELVSCDVRKRLEWKPSRLPEESGHRKDWRPHHECMQCLPRELKPASHVMVQVASRFIPVMGTNAK